MALAVAALRAETILPTENGATWEYVVRDSAKGGEPASVTVRINGTAQFGSKDLLKLETLVDDAVIKTEFISVDERGVHCHQRAGADGRATILEPPQTTVSFPLKIGATWQVDDHVAGSATQQFTITAEEEVTVPAGTFRTFRLHCDQPWPISTLMHRWFAPGTGVVKDVTVTRGPNGRLLSRATAVLKEFTVAPQRVDDTP
ncbi:MAG TPA: hypothetical protein VK993_16430, partial [Chthoniobacterales bacterium]|nr:hypothetical protein [Chthoniobacterales bacterium]